MKIKSTHFFLVLLAFIGTGCNKAQDVLTEKGKAIVWEIPFDVNLLNGWRDYNGTKLTSSWVVEKGITKAEGYGSDASGLLYHVSENPKFAGPYITRPEYQLIDDANFAEPLEERHKCGDGYAMYLPDPAKKWNNPVNWHDVHGANYIASYARNSVEMWGERFDPEVIDRELGDAQSMGLNSVRVWLDCRPYEDNPGAMLKRFEKFLELCEKHKLTAMPILFDSCGIEEKDLKEKGEDIHWGRWIANPGYDYLTPEHWDRLEKYVKDIVGTFLNDPRILAWDVMNEPWCDRNPENDEYKSVVLRFLKHFTGLVRSLNPDVPITIGVIALDRVEYVEDLVDLICFHSYETDPEKWRLLLTEANQYAELKGKPILLTEWGYPTWGTQVSAGRLMTDEDQLKFYEKVMPLVQESKIGWYFFDLIMGYGPFARLSVLKPNGDRRPSALVIEKYLEKKTIR